MTPEPPADSVPADGTPASAGDVEPATDLADRDARDRLLFTRAPTPMWLYDVETLRVLAVNDAALARYGYTRDQFLALTVLDLRPAEDVSAYLAHRASARGGRLERAAVRHRTRDGTPIDVDVVSDDVVYDGRRARLISATDVTERLRAQRAHEESERWFRSVFELSAVGMALTDRDGRLLRVNPHFCAMLGYTEAELLARTFVEITHPDDVEQNVDARDRLLAGEIRDYRLQKRYLRRDGAVVWVELTAAAIGPRDERGRPTAVITQMLDVTERKRTEASLRASEAELRAVLGAITDVVLVLDADGRYVKVAAASPEQLYRPPALLVGHTLAKVFPPDVAERFQRIVRQTLATGERAPFEYALDLDGQRRWFKGSASPMPNAPLVMWVARDVTAERDALDALAAREAELRQAQKLEAVGQLAGGVAHDFNNLLTVIRTYAELVRGEPGVDERSRRDLDEIVNAASRGATLTRQLLAFSRKQVLQPRVLDLNEIVRGAGALLRTAAGPAATLALDLSPEPAVVRADPGQLEQVLLNLVVNARDAMPDGGVLTIRTRTLPAGHAGAHAADPALEHGVELAVEDTGVGMSDAVRARVFEPFFTTKEVGKGTGLGLATVYGIVQQSGGRVAVESAPGAGSTFRVQLPSPLERPTARERAPGGGPERAAGAETVLLVDDEAGVREALRRVLGRAGYTVIDAADGFAALQAWDDASGSIDLVVTDLAMPGLGGRALAHHLRARRADVPVIVISGFLGQGGQGGSRAEPHAGLEWAAAVIEKPFTGETLVRAVRAALDARSARPPDA